MIFLKLIPYIIICFILGSIIKFLNYKNIINNLCFNIMNYSKKDYDDIYIYISTYIYWFFIIIFAITISFLQKQNILLYLFVERKYIIYIFINIFALISAFEIILAIISLFNKNIKTNVIFNNILSSAPINLLYSSRNNKKWTLILLASVIKCLFFNGIIYLSIKNQFQEFNLFFIILVVALLFSFEEMLRLNNFKEALIFIVSCFIITAINAISFEYTNSLIAPIFASVFFTIYYFGQFENMGIYS